ncbi:hypothetical protein AMECASPLE_033203 [Ameca splendens]|uniref:Uncharacterized protein n=1 Tax=Ameca splendens TaxID=208324 RepID=A0ABV0YIY2_9TELE
MGAQSAERHAHSFSHSRFLLWMVLEKLDLEILFEAAFLLDSPAAPQKHDSAFSGSLVLTSVRTFITEWVLTGLTETGPHFLHKCNFIKFTFLIHQASSLCQRKTCKL